MSINKYLISLLLGTAITVNPAAVEAGGMSHVGSVGQMHGVSPVPINRNCKQGGQGQAGGIRPATINNNIQVYKPVNVNSDVTVYKPVNINNNLNVQTNIDNSKDINIYKPVSITNNIDASKSIAINKPISISKSINITNNIDNSKYIDASKNIDINKTIIINKGGGGHGGGGSQSGSSSQADAEAEAVAIASAVAAAMANSHSSSSAVVNFNGSSNSSASSSAYNNSSGSESSSSAFGYSGAGTVSGSSSYIAEAPGAFAGGDLGTINIETTPIVAAAPAQCTFQDTSVVKAIHAVCLAADGHEFPASHMVPETWINSSYEGEIARCIPGSHLKVVIGKVMQSSEGMATGFTSGQVLECGLHEAVRHYKDGVLKCAPAVAVPDCTERTNLRKYGTGDMFFTYRAKVCLETHDEYPVTASIKNDHY